MYLLASKFRFLEFRLLLSRVALYYSSLPRFVQKELLTQRRLLEGPRINFITSIVKIENYWLFPIQTIFFLKTFPL